MATKTQGCSGLVYYPGSFRGGHDCSRRGKVAREGKLYCYQHDPVKVATRRAEADSKRKVDYDSARAIYARQAAERTFCAGVQLPEGVTLKELLETTRNGGIELMTIMEKFEEAQS